MFFSLLITDPIKQLLEKDKCYNQCFRCKGEKKGQECFLVTEEMDVVEEEDDHHDRDSGMETDGEMELFPEE